MELSTQKNISGYIHISDEIWYHARISISSGNIISVTSINNYDDKGGEVISNSSLTIDSDVETFSFQASADNTSYTVLAESWIE